MKALIQRFLVGRLVASFVGRVPNAIRNHLNVGELLRIVGMTALTGGSAYEVLPALLSQVGVLVAAPEVGWVTALLTLAIEVRRRLQHGAEPKLNLP